MDIFKEDYIDIVNQIKAPAAKAVQIYLCLMLTLQKAVNFKNDYTNLDKLKLINDTIKEVAAETQVNLIHSNSMFESEDTYLPDEWTSGWLSFKTKKALVIGWRWLKKNMNKGEEFIWNEALRWLFMSALLSAAVTRKQRNDIDKTAETMISEYYNDEMIKANWWSNPQYSDDWYGEEYMCSLCFQAVMKTKWISYLQRWRWGYS